MSRTWRFLGLASYLVAAGLYGCTITTGDVDDSYEEGGATSEEGGATSEEGGATSEEGGATSEEGGATSAGGAGGEGGEGGAAGGSGLSTQLTTSITDVCALDAFVECYSDSATCESTWVDLAKQGTPDCDETLQTYFDCVTGLDSTSMSCTDGSIVADDCADYETAIYDCIG